MSESEINVLWGCCPSGGDNETEFMNCISCGKSYHLACINSGNAKASFTRLTTDWTCPKCSIRPKGGNSDNTPLRCTKENVSMRASKRAALQSPKLDVEGGLTRNDVREVVQDIFNDQMEKLFIRFDKHIKATVDAALVPVTEDIQELKQSLVQIHRQHEETAGNISQLSDTVKELQTENSVLRSYNQNLSERLNQLEQYARNANIEIQCVPERKNDDIVKIVSNIGKTIGCAVKSDEIMNCNRIAKLNPKGSRPRSIIVRFISPRLRDTFLAACIKFNRSNANEKLNSSHAGLAGEKTSIFVVEHLSPTNKALHAKARMAAKENGYKHIWVRNGRIYLRKTDTSDHKLVKNSECLLKLD